MPGPLFIIGSLYKVDVTFDQGGSFNSLEWRIYASVNSFSIWSGSGLSPVRCQAITWINADLFFIWPPGTNFSEIAIEIQKFKLMIMHFKMSSAKWRPFCPGEMSSSFMCHHRSWIIPCFPICCYVLRVGHVSWVITNFSKRQWLISSLNSIGWRRKICPENYYCYFNTCSTTFYYFGRVSLYSIIFYRLSLLYCGWAVITVFNYFRTRTE